MINHIPLNILAIALVIEYLSLKSPSIPKKLVFISADISNFFLHCRTYFWAKMNRSFFYKCRKIWGNIPKLTILNFLRVMIFHHCFWTHFSLNFPPNCPHMMQGVKLFWNGLASIRVCLTWSLWKWYAM